jgi:hypothetical protein
MGGKMVTVCFFVRDVATVPSQPPYTAVVLRSTRPARPRDFIVAVALVEPTMRVLFANPLVFLDHRIEVVGEVTTSDPSLPPQMAVVAKSQFRLVGP